MSGKTSTLFKALGLGLIVLGAGLGYWGYDMSQGLGAQLTETFSGSMPDEVLIRYIGGAASFAVGLVLLLKG